MNWGHKITLVFIAFAALIGTMVYKCMNKNFELVSADYYDDELHYQDKIDGFNNAEKLSPLIITQTASQLQITLPNNKQWKQPSGQLWFYCANNATSDRKMPLQLNGSNVMTLSKTKLVRTGYTLKITWQDSGTKYYNEQLIAIK